MPIISSSSSSASEFHGFIKSNSQTEGEINEMAGNYQTAPKKETKLEWIRGRLESWITWYRTWRNPPGVISRFLVFTAPMVSLSHAKHEKLTDVIACPRQVTIGVMRVHFVNITHMFEKKLPF